MESEALTFWRLFSDDFKHRSKATPIFKRFKEGDENV
jgi:hypothetical protein